MRLVYIQISPMRLLLSQMLCFFYSWIFMRSCRGGDRLIWWSQAQKLHPPIVKVSNNRKPIRRRWGLKGERDKIDPFRQRMKWRLHQGPESVLSFFSFLFFSSSSSFILRERQEYQLKKRHKKPTLLKMYKCNYISSSEISIWSPRTLPEFRLPQIAITQTIMYKYFWSSVVMCIKDTCLQNQCLTFATLQHDGQDQQAFKGNQGQKQTSRSLE